MKNNNQKIIRKISSRSLKNNRMRNLFAAVAIALTCMLFTALACMGVGMMQVVQEETMREVGGNMHAGLKHAALEVMEKVTEDPRVVDYSWNIYLGNADNVLKRNAELRYAQGEKELSNSFIQLEEGRLPQEEDEIVVDTIVMDEQKVPHSVGETITLEFTFLGEQIQKTFTVSGWYQGDYISHASQLYISQAYWDELKGERTEEDFMAWGKEHPNDAAVGLYNVNLFFKSTKNIEDTIRSVISDAGYDPDGEVDYGVNWAYMSSRTEGLDPNTMLLIGAAVVVVLLTGYLIIYNIFQISVINDIRFYGLLKTLGATKRQLRRLIYRQAAVLSVIGIPIGLAAGYLISTVMFPFAMSFIDVKGMEIRLHFDPIILLFGAVFSFLTVLIGCRKPGKIAGSVSAVEAVRYSEGSVKRRRQKKSETGARVHRMALSNLGRSKKKTVFVVLSLSFSVAILCVVLTAVGSFRIDSYLNDRLIGDVVVGSTNYTVSYTGAGDYVADEQMLSLLDSQEGIITREGMYAPQFDRNLKLDDAAVKRYESFRSAGRLREENEIFSYELDEAIRQRMLTTHTFAYDNGLFQNLTVLSGELDVEKFQSGDYVLITPIIGDHTGDCMIYEPGDKVTVEFATPDTEYVEEKNEDGETIGIEYKNMEQKEYEVMAIVDIPNSMDEHRYAVNSVHMVLPKQEILQEETSGYCFAVSYTLEEYALPAFVETAKNYTENQNLYMGYLTKESLMKEFSGMINVVTTVGVGLCATIAIVGILNFVNSMVTGIIARKRELAILSSIGMTKQQLERMLIQEGLYYVLISGILSIVTGSLLSYAVLGALNQVILFFEYRYNVWAFVIMLPLFAVIAVVSPSLAYKKAAKESVVERLRNTEN